jgi:hypothetical protein
MEKVVVDAETREKLRGLSGELALPRVNVF